MNWTPQQYADWQAAQGKPKPTLPKSPKAVSTWCEVEPSKDVSGLNKTEAAFLDYLKATKPAWLGVQNLTLKLADRCRYTPDFATVNPESGRFEFWEVKGFMRDDAAVKLKTAARLFPWANFWLVKRDKPTGWNISEVAR